MNGHPVKMIRLLLTAMLICCTGYLSAQDIPGLMKKAADQVASFNEQAALKTYQQVLRIQPTHQVALVKCSELCSSIGFRQQKTEARDDYYRAARKYAELALRLNAKDPAAHVAMAIVLGRAALVAPAKDKVAASRDIRNHAELALLEDPANFKAYHILGKWHFEMSTLGSMERAAIKLFYGGMPKASLQESIQYFEKTRLLEPGFLLNYLELAKAYDKNNERKKAREALEQLLKLKDATEEDALTRQEATALLKKWK